MHMLLLARSWVLFRWEGLIFQDIHTKQIRSSSISGYKMQKIYGGKIYSGSAPLARNYTNRILSQKMAQEVWKIKLLHWESQFGLNYVLIKSNRTALQTYKVEERFFGTPCRHAVSTVSVLSKGSDPFLQIVACVIVGIKKPCCK